MVWSVAGLLHFTPQSMQNATAKQTAESAIQSSNCIAQKLVPAIIIIINDSNTLL